MTITRKRLMVLRAAEPDLGGGPRGVAARKIVVELLDACEALLEENERLEGIRGRLRESLEEGERLREMNERLRTESVTGWDRGFEACREKAAKAVIKFGPYHGSNWIAEQVMNLTPESDE
jgi:hypothetical protein